jgi:hypothetical protein
MMILLCLNSIYRWVPDSSRLRLATTVCVFLRATLIKNYRSLPRVVPGTAFHLILLRLSNRQFLNLGVGIVLFRVGAIGFFFTYDDSPCSKFDSATVAERMRLCSSLRHLLL